MNKEDCRTRVFIIGAGLGGLSAAWYLSKHRRDVEVIVCEASWVPGGKAVSGRADPPEGGGLPHFVEEHGLHMLFGTYHETWQMLADCYRAVDRPVSHAFRRIEQAFTPQGRVVFDERAPRNGRRQHWVFSPEEKQGSPWDPDAPPPADDMALLQRLIGQMGTQSRNLQATAVRMRGGVSALPFLHTGAAPLRTAPLPPYKQMEMPDTEAMRSWTRRASSACSARRSLMVQPPPPTVSLVQFLRLATSARRTAELLDLIFAILDGTRELAHACTCPRGECHCFDQLNADDLHDWLRSNGLQKDNDAIVRGFYAGLFARPGDLAAGVGLRAILRVLFDYRGAMVYRMESGMGEVVVAPLYQTLRKRGVEFRFFHRLTRIDLDGNQISELHFEGLGALEEFEPFKTTESLHGTLEYFPNVPRPSSLAKLEALADGEFRQMHRRWTSRGSASSVRLDPRDIVILAVPPKVLKQVAAVLEENPTWAEFLSGDAATRSCRIASAQIWRNVSSEAAQNPIGRGVAAGQAEPFSVWADMSHILTREGVPHRATELSFVCGVGQAEAAATQAGQLEGLAEQVETWLSTEGSSYMLGRTGEEVHRYLAASLEPSDEYVLSAPGTIERRIEPADTGFVNLRVAGDWVRSGLDCGCVESAVTGGILAAKSIP